MNGTWDFSRREGGIVSVCPNSHRSRGGGIGMEGVNIAGLEGAIRDTEMHKFADEFCPMFQSMAQEALTYATRRESSSRVAMNESLRCAIYAREAHTMPSLS